MFEVSYLTQVSEPWFSHELQDVIKRTSRTVNYVKDYHVSIDFPKLDLSTLHVIGYSDVSLSSNYGIMSQLGYILLLIDAARQF